MSEMTNDDVHVETQGQGPPVLLIHSDVSTGHSGWRKQITLSQRWRLTFPDRPGYGKSASAHRVDFEREATIFEPLLERGTHLVGHSYGGIVAMFLAAAAPERVRSLTLVEPPALGLTDAPEAINLRKALQALWEDGPRDPFEFFHLFADLVGERPWPRPPLPPSMEAGVRALMGERVVWEADPDLDALARAPFPILVVSGGHAPGFEALCDAIAGRVRAQRAVIRGAGHSVPRLGRPFNELLEQFWLNSEGASQATEMPQHRGGPSLT